MKSLKSLTAAIIGLGNIAPMHAKSLTEIGVKITAVCDKNKSIAESFALGLPSCAAFDDYNEMLEKADFDVLHICLPHFLHAPVAIAALKKGVHVLTEKPMATTVEDAEDMISAARESKKTLGVIFQNRYSPGAALIKSALESGELGTVKGGWIRVTWNRPESYYAISDWKGKWATEGGGALINQSIHCFDLMNFFLGEPTAIDASIANRAHPSIEVEDVAEGVVTYGTAPISFFVNTYHLYDAPAALELICENGYATLTGEEATITMNNGQQKTSAIDTEAQKRFRMKSYWGVSHIKQIEDFYKSLATGEPVKIDGTEALRTQRLVNGIYESAKTGRVVNRFPKTIDNSLEFCL